MPDSSDPVLTQVSRDQGGAQGEVQNLLALNDTPPVPATTITTPVRKRFSRRARKLAIVLLRITSTVILVVMLVISFAVGPTLRWIRTPPSSGEQQAIT